MNRKRLATPGLNFAIKDLLLGVTFFLSATVTSCGSPVSQGPGGSSPSGARPASPSPQESLSSTPTPSTTPSGFLPGDCTYPMTGATRTQPVNDTFQASILVPPGWTLQDTSGMDNTDFLMTAPTSYKYSPSTIVVSPPLPTSPGQTPGTYLAQFAQRSVSITASPQTCTVGGDQAAFLSFTSGAKVGYMVLWFHFGDAYRLDVQGNGGVDQRAVQDAKGVLASVTYAHNVPPPGYSPSPSP
jgi:hypothetical protein